MAIYIVLAFVLIILLYVLYLAFFRIFKVYFNRKFEHIHSPSQHEVGKSYQELNSCRNMRYFACKGSLTFIILITDSVDMSVHLQRVLEDKRKLPFKDKLIWFEHRIGKLMRPWKKGRLKLQIRRERITLDSLELLLGIKQQHLHMPIRILFQNERGMDAGGIHREWFDLFSTQIFTSDWKLFTPCCHLDTVERFWFTTSNQNVLYYKGIGRAIGRSLLDGQQVAGRFAIPILKHILGEQVDHSDLQYIDHQVYHSMKILKTLPTISDLGLTFTIEDQIDLIPNGRNISVHQHNLDAYLHARYNYLLHASIQPALTHFLAGLFDIIPQKWFTIFNTSELDLLLSGKFSIDLHDWQTSTETNHHPLHTTWFWQIISSWNQTQQQRFLQYTTGSSRVPIQGFQYLTSYDGIKCPFTIQWVEYNSNSILGHYPHVHTCYNKIEIPLYPTKSLLEIQLSYLFTLSPTGFTSD